VKGSCEQKRCGKKEAGGRCAEILEAVVIKGDRDHTQSHAIVFKAELGYYL
jgi:hypothetical protein